MSGQFLVPPKALARLKLRRFADAARGPWRAKLLGVWSWDPVVIPWNNLRIPNHPSSALVENQRIPSGNQTWQWKIHYLLMIFPVKHPFAWDFLLPRLIIYQRINWQKTWRRWTSQEENYDTSRLVKGHLHLYFLSLELAGFRLSSTTAAQCWKKNLRMARPRQLLWGARNQLSTTPRTNVWWSETKLLKLEAF